MSDEFSVLRNFQRASDDPRATTEYEHRMNRVREREAEREALAIPDLESVGGDERSAT